MEAIFGLVGVALGFVLNEWATRRRETQTERRQAQSLRTLLSLEIDHNIALLKDWWGEVLNVGTPDKDPDLHRRDLARRLVEFPLPSWAHKMWESQSSLLAIALNHAEIKQVHDIHNGLDAIAAIRSALVAAETEQRQDWRSASQGKGFVPLSVHVSRKFERMGPQLCTQCESIVNELLAKANPLAPTPNRSSADWDTTRSRVGLEPR